MVTATAIKEWLNHLPPDAQVGIDEGGLTLIVFDDPDSYFEIGGIPECICVPTLNEPHPNCYFHGEEG